MTDREKAIVSAYTGITMLTGDKFSIFHKYITDILGRPVYTHELANESVWNEIKEKSYGDFIEICKKEDNTEERPCGEWIPNYKSQFINPGRHCYLCGKCVQFSENFCPQCGADMRGNKT